MDEHGQGKKFLTFAEAQAIDKLDKLKDLCHDAIKRRGAHARALLKVPGKWGAHNNKRLYPGGPVGQIVAVTHDRKKVIVMFRAANTLTELEETRNAIITGRLGSGKIDELNTGLRVGVNGQENHRNTGGAHNKKGAAQGDAPCVVSTESNVLF